MKIIFCLHHFLPDYVAGTEIYTLRLAQHLHSKGIAVAVLIPHFNSLQNDEYEWEGIRVIRYAENSVEDRRMFFGYRKPDGLATFSDIVSREKPDVIHFHELSPGRGISIFHTEAAHALNIPVVLTFHLSVNICFKGSLVYKDVAKCDGIIQIKKCVDCIYQEKNVTGIKATVLSAVSRSLFSLHINANKLDSTIGTALGFPFIVNKMKTDLLKLAGLAENIVVLTKWYQGILENNGVPASKLVYIKQGLTNDVQLKPAAGNIGLPVKIVFIGRLSPQKGLHLLIDAICSLPQEKVSLHIYGKQTEDGYVAGCEQKSKDNKNIHWMGAIDPGNVISALSAYHVLCLPSTFSEMSPLVIQEAYAAGLPVLASDVYGNAEQVNDGVNGWLFRFKDSDDLTAKLRALTEQPSLIEKARKNLPAVCMFSQVADRHIDMYTKIATKKNSLVQ